MTSTFFSASFGFWRWIERQNALNALGDPDPSPAQEDEEDPAGDSSSQGG